VTFHQPYSPAPYSGPVIKGIGNRKPVPSFVYEKTGFLLQAAGASGNWLKTACGRGMDEGYKNILNLRVATALCRAAKFV
jgi:hypothetical protein